MMMIHDEPHGKYIGLALPQSENISINLISMERRTKASFELEIYQFILHDYPISNAARHQHYHQHLFVIINVDI